MQRKAKPFPKLRMIVRTPTKSCNFFVTQKLRSHRRRDGRTAFRWQPSKVRDWAVVVVRFGVVAVVGVEVAAELEVGAPAELGVGAAARGDL